MTFNRDLEALGFAHGTALVDEYIFSNLTSEEAEIVKATPDLTIGNGSLQRIIFQNIISQSDLSFSVKQAIAWLNSDGNYTATQWGWANFDGAALNYLCVWRPRFVEIRHFVKNPNLTEAHIIAVLSKGFPYRIRDITSLLKKEQLTLPVLLAAKPMEDNNFFSEQTAEWLILLRDYLGADAMNLPDEWLLKLYSE
jgi:hypothetical protein